MIDLVFQNLTSDKFFKDNFFKKILSLVAEELKLKKNIEVSLSLVGESKIKELNNKYRNKNKVTDVLSFPMIQDTKYVTHDTDLGDIFICLPFAKNQAKSENISIESKLAQLTVHGFLHLAGYDHEGSSRKAREMFDLENRILKKLSVFLKSLNPNL